MGFEMNKKITLVMLSVLLGLSACNKTPVVDVGNEEVRQDLTNPDAQRMSDSMQKEAFEASSNDESEAQANARPVVPESPEAETAVTPPDNAKADGSSDASNDAQAVAENAVNHACEDCDEDHDGTWNDFREIHLPAYSPSENCKMDSNDIIMELCKEICKKDGCDCDDFYNRYDLGKGNEIDEFIKLKCETDDALLCQKLKTAFSSSWDKCIENEKSEMIKYLEDRCTEGAMAWNDDRGDCWINCDKNKNDKIDDAEKSCLSKCIPGCVEKVNFYRELKSDDIQKYYKQDAATQAIYAATTE